MLVCVLDHHDAGVDHGSDRDGDAAERHDVGVDALVVHHDEREQDAEREQQDRDEGAPDVYEEYETNQRNNQRLLQKLLAQVVDRALDERCAVVNRHDLNARR